MNHARVDLSLSSSTKDVASRSSAAATAEDDLFSLDFTSLPPPVAPVKAAPKLEWSLEPLSTMTPAESPQPQPQPQPSSSLSLLSLSSGSEPSSLSPAVVPPSSPPFPCVRLDAPLEEAALSYAAGQSAVARRTLEEVVAGEAAAEPVWAMLLDLYRLMHERALFEPLALAFAQRFEKSPPAWQMDEEKQKAATGDGRASVTLTGMLNARCAPQFAKLVAVAKTRPLLQVDLAKIKSVDDGGAALLLDLLRQMKKSGSTLVLTGMEHLVALMTPQLVTGERTHEPSWLLLLELYQRLGRPESFDEAALDYAITFEVSPPSWEDVPKVSSQAADDAPTRSASRAAASSPEAGDFGLQGEVLATDGTMDAQPFAALSAALAAAQPEVLSVDLASLRRLDVPMAQHLQRVLQAAPAGRKVRLLNCNALVAALLEMAGVGLLAQVLQTRI